VNGCTVAAVFSEYADGVRNGIVTHFESEFSKDSDGFFVNAKGAPIKTVAKIFVYGENKENLSKLEINLHERSAREANFIKSILRKNFGDQIEIDIVPYPLSENANEEREIGLIVKSKKDGEDSPAEIEWWNGTIPL
jgi:hypothetical protein